MAGLLRQRFARAKQKKLCYAVLCKDSRLRTRLCLQDSSSFLESSPRNVARFPIADNQSTRRPRRQRLYEDLIQGRRVLWYIKAYPNFQPPL